MADTWVFDRNNQFDPPCEIGITDDRLNMAGGDINMYNDVDSTLLDAIGACYTGQKELENVCGGKMNTFWARKAIQTAKLLNFTKGGHNRTNKFRNPPYSADMAMDFYFKGEYGKSFFL